MRREVIIGHTYKKKNDNNWIIIVALVLIVVFFVSLKFVEREGNQPPQAKAEKSAAPSPVKTEAPKEAVKIVEPIKEQPITENYSGIKVLEAVFSDQMSGNVPASDSDNFQSGDKVYFYTKIDSSVTPLPIKHVYCIPQGDVYNSVDLHAYNKPSDVWSYIILPSGITGRWTAKAVVAGKIIAEKSFNVE